MAQICRQEESLVNTSPCLQKLIDHKNTNPSPVSLIAPVHLSDLKPLLSLTILNLSTKSLISKIFTIADSLVGLLLVKGNHAWEQEFLSEEIRTQGFIQRIFPSVYIGTLLVPSIGPHFQCSLIHGKDLP